MSRNSEKTQKKKERIERWFYWGKKIWESGGNYITSLPRDWAKNIRSDYDSKIDMIRIGDKILITPHEISIKKPLIEEIISSGNIAEIRMKGISAYIKGLDGIDMKIKNTEKYNWSDIQKILSASIPATVERISPEKVRVYFTPPYYGYNIKDLISEFKNVLTMMYNEVKDVFGNIEEVKKKVTIIKDFEKRSDNITYYFRRIINRALLSAKELKDLEVKKENDLIYYSLIVGYLERGGDLEEEILDQFIKIYDSYIKIKDRLSDKKLTEELRKKLIELLNSFKNLYEYSFKTVQHVYNALTEDKESAENKLTCGGLIKEEGISENDKKWTAYNEGKLKEKISEVKKSIKEFNIFLFNEIIKHSEDRNLYESCTDLIRHIIILEGKIRAIPDIMLNICEILWNMNFDNIKKEEVISED